MKLAVVSLGIDFKPNKAGYILQDDGVENAVAASNIHILANQEYNPVVVSALNLCSRIICFTKY